MIKIGILTRQDILNNKEILYIPKKIYEYVNYNKIRIMLIPYTPQSTFNKIIDIVNLCDGIILPGGDDETEIEIKIVKYLHKNDIPTLGICLGMQVMALATNGQIKKINNLDHKRKEKYVHKIKIDSNSFLFSILKRKTINVNSSHEYEVIKTTLDISARSLDSVVEALEDPYKRFFVGVQYHPEKVNDIYSYRLIKAFINSLI